MHTIDRQKLYDFVKESNYIEGIDEARPEECLAYETFLRVPVVQRAALLDLLFVVQPDARLRCRGGMDVIIGGHLPPAGGEGVVASLDSLLHRVTSGRTGAWRAHCEYELLHPMTDGNGRTGRALWAWQQLHCLGGSGIDLGFLHMFYYQTLANQQGASRYTE